MLRSLKWRFITLRGDHCLLHSSPFADSDLPVASVVEEDFACREDPSRPRLAGRHVSPPGGEGDKAVESYVEQIKNNLKDDLKDQGIPVGKLEREKDRIVLEFSGAKEKVDNLLSTRFTTCA